MSAQTATTPVHAEVAPSAACARGDEHFFFSAIAEVHGVRSAAITLDHTADAQRIDVEPYITVRTREAVPHTETVSCAIPGHDHPGQEIVADIMRIDDPELAWEVRGRCGFATDFSYVG